MQYGEADLQGRDFAKQVGRVTAQQCAHTAAHRQQQRDQQAIDAEQRKIIDRGRLGRGSIGGVFWTHSCSSAYTQGVTSHSLSPPSRKQRPLFPSNLHTCIYIYPPTHPHPARAPLVTCTGPAPLQLHICRHPQGQLPGHQPAGRLPDEGGRLPDQFRGVCGGLVCVCWRAGGRGGVSSACMLPVCLLPVPVCCACACVCLLCVGSDKGRIHACLKSA